MCISCISNWLYHCRGFSSTGTIISISEQREGGVSLQMGQQYGYYEAFFDEDSQNAGAYIFRPDPGQYNWIKPRSDPNSVLVYESDIGTEVHAEFGGEFGDPSWIKQITRLIDGADYVEVEYVVGPVPIDDGIGKEVVSTYFPDIENDGIFYTDSNGREFMKRKRNTAQIEPQAENYYPVNTAVFIEDASTEDESASFSVLVDRSQGGSSLSDGALQLMIQRRILHDDSRGVGEALNETDAGITACPPYGNATRLGDGIIVKGTHRLMIGLGKTGASLARSQMDRVFSPPHIFVASEQRDAQIPFRQASLSLLKAALPENVMVITFSALDEGGTFLVRLAQIGRASCRERVLFAV